MRTLRSASARPPYALVAGEHPDLVLEGMLAVRPYRPFLEVGPDGVTRTLVDLAGNPHDLSMGPFLRALMRVEAELLLRDADEVGCAAMRRTDAERRGNAFAVLARRVCVEMDRCGPAVQAPTASQPADMGRISWRAPDELVERVRRTADGSGLSVNAWITRVLDAAAESEPSGAEADRSRERLACAGLLAERSGHVSSERPDPAAVAEARAAAGSGTPPLSRLVIDGRG